MPRGAAVAAAGVAAAAAVAAAGAAPGAAPVAGYAALDFPETREKESPTLIPQTPTAEESLRSVAATRGPSLRGWVAPGSSSRGALEGIV